jgi:hypothetical protein
MSQEIEKAAPGADGPPRLSARHRREVARLIAADLNIAGAAGAIGLSRSELLQRAAHDPELAQAIDDAREEFADGLVAECASLAKRGDRDLLKFLLASLRKFGHGVKVSVEVPRDLSKLSDQELADLVVKLEAQGL